MTSTGKLLDQLTGWFLSSLTAALFGYLFGVALARVVQP